MEAKGAQVRTAGSYSANFHSARPSRGELIKTWGPRLAYGAAATWYVRSGPTGSWQEKLARRGAATALGIGIFKGKDIYKWVRGENKNGIHKSNFNHTNRSRRGSRAR